MTVVLDIYGAILPIIFNLLHKTLRITLITRLYLPVSFVCFICDGVT